MHLCQELLRGAIDLHTHPSPSIFERLMDDDELATCARAAGMRGLLYKAHEQDTTGRALMVRKRVEGIEVYGGVVLNHVAGGINPHAVDAAIRLGAKMVWMPTISAQHHLDFFGGAHFGSSMRAKKPGKPVSRGLSVLNDHGELLPEVQETLGLIAEADICLSTGHLGIEEIHPLVRGAKQAGVRKILITHPDLALSGISLGDQKALAAEGAIIEKDFNTMTPPWSCTTIEAMAKSIRELGPAHCVLATDYGQLHSPPPPEGLRLFIQLLTERGFSPEEIRTMTARNPASLLGIEGEMGE